MLDQEWVDLILEAKHLGLTIEDIKEFLKENTDSNNRPKTG